MKKKSRPTSPCIMFCILTQTSNAAILILVTWQQTLKKFRLTIFTFEQTPIQKVKLCGTCLLAQEWNKVKKSNSTSKTWVDRSIILKMDTNHLAFQSSTTFKMEKNGVMITYQAFSVRKMTSTHIKKIRLIKEVFTH